MKNEPRKCKGCEATIPGYETQQPSAYGIKIYCSRACHLRSLRTFGAYRDVHKAKAAADGTPAGRNEPRTCKFCQQVIPGAATETASVYGSRTFCGRGCSAKYMRAQRHKKGGPKPLAPSYWDEETFGL